ncbi:hypothetical protein L1887_61833 [Cichorium endivia]|nr:hypothetical protein L1887_61833 [Cichorium endivia]
MRCDVDAAARAALAEVRAVVPESLHDAAAQDRIEGFMMVCGKQRATWMAASYKRQDVRARRKVLVVGARARCSSLCVAQGMAWKKDAPRSQISPRPPTTVAAKTSLPSRPAPSPKSTDIAQVHLHSSGTAKDDNRGVDVRRGVSSRAILLVFFVRTVVDIH